MEFLHQLDPTTAVVLISSALIIVIVLFAKYIKGILKLAIIVLMALFILYYLKQAGTP